MQQQYDPEFYFMLNSSAEQLGSWGVIADTMGLFLLPVILPVLGIILGIEALHRLKDIEAMGDQPSSKAESRAGDTIAGGVLVLLINIGCLIVLFLHLAAH
jgi:hypothetical protein